MQPGDEGRTRAILPAVNQKRTSLIALAVVVGPLRAMLDELKAATSRTKRVAANPVIKEEDWAKDQLAAWEGATAVLQNAVTLASLKVGCELLIFLDASDLYRGGCLAQVAPADLYNGKGRRGHIL